MTHQEVFDKVAKHLLTQRVKSKLPNSASSCAYRGVGGTMCAVGCLIPDEDYDRGMEGLNVRKMLRNYKVPSLQYVNIELLVSLQNIHDVHPVGQWKDSLKILATKTNLEFNV